MRLNQFIAHAGICSRRKAERLILSQQIEINGKLITELHYQVTPEDTVTYQGKVLKLESKTYVLLNKPKGTITTVHDPQGRKTVMQLVPQNERIYPVGRLDCDTTGLLLLTNDGALAQKLAHPSQKIVKTYEVQVTQKLASADLHQLKKGVLLKDGWARVDVAQILDKKQKRVSIKLHSGKNRIIRRLFHALHYTIVSLDRIGYGPLVKGTLALGQWRTLTAREVEQCIELTKTRTPTKLPM